MSNTATAIETTARFECKETDPETLWIVIEHDATETPQLVEDLRDAGWQTPEDRGMRSLPPLGGVAETHLTRKGSELFCGWSAAERKSFVSEARAIMRRHGFTGVPVNKRPWQDFL
jgi:hypothetical protein